MSESCTAQIVNNSGRQLDAVGLWHSPDSESLWTSPVTRQAAVPAGATVSCSVPLAWSALDYWGLVVLYKGDGTCYFLMGDFDSPYKEFEVSDGTTITFTLPAYTEGTTEQGVVLIAYSGGDSDSGNLYNQTTALAVSPVGDIIEGLVHLGADMAGV